VTSNNWTVRVCISARTYSKYFVQVAHIYHQIHEQLLFKYFYGGMMSMDREMIYAGNEEAFVHKTPVVAKQLIESMTSNNH